MKSVLSIAGSDSSGGAGIQADIKTITAMGLFAQTAITALTAQNTTGVYGIADVEPQFVTKQIDVIFDDIRPDAVKIGMVSSEQVAYAISDALRRNGAKHVVVDPVMVATSGAELSKGTAIEAVIARLFPLAEVITPNMAEAQALTGLSIDGRAAQEQAARALVAQGVHAALVKGGHSEEGEGRADDVLACAEGSVIWFEGPRIDTDNTHGTGCTLSSAIACGLAQGLGLPDAVRQAKEYVTSALAAGLNLGRGSGPLHHMWRYV